MHLLQYTNLFIYEQSEHLLSQLTKKITYEFQKSMYLNTLSHFHKIPKSTDNYIVMNHRFCNYLQDNSDIWSNCLYINSICYRKLRDNMRSYSYYYSSKQWKDYRHNIHPHKHRNATYFHTF